MTHFPFDVPPHSASDAQALMTQLDAAAIPVDAFCMSLRNVLLGQERIPDLWTQALAMPLVEQAAQWLGATFSEAERFQATAVQAGTIFDGLVSRGAMSPAELAAYFQQVMGALVRREPIAPLQDAAANDALQWLCDLVVDAANADPAVLVFAPLRVNLVASGESTAAAFFAYLAEKVTLRT
jgi:hypothetical protein